MWPKFDHEPIEKVRITVSSVAIRAPEKRKTAMRVREVLLMAVGPRGEAVHGSRSTATAHGNSGIT